ncbi:unnamed protein product [Didymodactylos carnosus]|uniref:Uncharacterized protein n=1 Tax=Didymodactylos carnosus TaxID=1234261 RepID=A0A815DEV5_9BILA|nr:unnamed protein product [Didymodactylos carnosus]CAF1296981.1 unnamed protein product [Didymodactylos carnosus]CAF3962590.1 unnamed protein product [Didymodactylos carnosus]CAF4113360.1 unnamed protein product [Didymodactylos carnosus]
MLDSGVYFAPSVEDTVGKARGDGAWFVAQIRMGKIFQINKNELYPVDASNPNYNKEKDILVKSSAWYSEYDTCYLNHGDDSRDEFVVKDREQIIKWVVVIERPHNSTVEYYGLDKEFDSTPCGCSYAKARFVVLFDGVPLTADEKQGEVLFGVEIRGWRPASGPRGYIATAFNTTTLEDFTENYRNVGEFTFTPDVFPGYFWFFRPFLTFSKFNVVSTNFMTAAASESFHVQGFPMRCS